jgi:hypothetical protein
MTSRTHRHGVAAIACTVLLQLLALQPAHAAAAADTADTVDARALVEHAIELTRSRGSVSELTMNVHRPDWQRTSSLKAWTRGREDALIRFTAPARDAGNATLKRGRDMWTFAPRVNRVIRLPASLMSQSWAGSDFSYNDLARSDELLLHYELRRVGEAREDGHVVHTIDAVPRANAPVVWGRQRMRLRTDGVMLEVTYFDQDQRPVKRMQAMQVSSLGGRTFATRMRMTDLGERDHYTEIVYGSATFDQALPDEQFTQFALRNTR